MLTGKCKEDFEKWYELNINEIPSAPKVYRGQTYIDDFYHLPLSMQYGVYVDFFEWARRKWKLNDSFKIPIDTFVMLCIWLDLDPMTTTETEARQKAIEKANEIYNVK